MTITAAIRELATFFRKSENHLDDDPLHISKEELRGAWDRVSDPTKELIDAVTGDESSYEAIRNIQKEGVFNDRQVSLRDLHAAARGTSYHGESLAPQRETLFARLQRATERLEERRKSDERFAELKATPTDWSCR